MKKIFILFFVCFFLCGCNASLKKENTLNLKEEIMQVIEKNNYTIVDVRTQEEYEQDHIKGSILIPYDEINDTITLEKNKTILVYCQSGRRSKIAYDKLKKLGYVVIDMGGIEEVPLKHE